MVAKGDTKATVHLERRAPLRPPRRAARESYGNLLQHFTGSKEHNVALREDAVRRGFSVSEYGVTNIETGEVFTAADEEELYAHLGYAFIPPELRENGGELAAARNGELPALVERGDLRGDLHSHTTWSDGKATLEEMAPRGTGARPRVPRDLRPLAAPARGPAGARSGRRSTRSTSGSRRSGS